jgi:AmmeMemoRadiSam system protein A
MDDRQHQSSSFLNLKDHQKRTLLEIARKTLKQFLTDKEISLEKNSDPDLNRKHGVFVTLLEHAKLRGCVGHLKGDQPIYETTALMAIQAAVNDNRFKPVTLDELPDIELEISILSPFKQISDEKQIQLGHDGVLLVKGDVRGVFLPQVPIKMNWDRIQLLRQLCKKVGLPLDGWKENTHIYTFQTEVFYESDFK